MGGHVSKARNLSNEMKQFINEDDINHDPSNHCFQVKINDRISLSFSFPYDKRGELETALFRDNEIVYNQESGYSDVIIHDPNINAAMAEYNRIKKFFDK